MKKLKTYTCPCCNKAKTKEDMNFVLSRSEIIASDTRFCEQCWGSVESRKDNPFYLPYKRWACDQCITNRKAILANPSRQQFQEDVPYFAYFDKELECVSCRATFIFTMETQQKWFEEWKLWVTQDSYPKNCPNCREQQRENKRLQRRLMELLKEEHSKDIQKLELIANIYKEMGNTGKYDLYLRKIINLKHKTYP